MIQCCCFTSATYLCTSSEYHLDSTAFAVNDETFDKVVGAQLANVILACPIVAVVLVFIIVVMLLVIYI